MGEVDGGTFPALQQVREALEDEGDIIPVHDRPDIQLGVLKQLPGEAENGQHLL